MTGQPEALPVTALRSYMRAAGWDEGVHGTAGSLWTKGPYRFAVPHEDDDQLFVRGAVERLAQAEGRTPDETEAAVLAFRDLSVPADEYPAFRAPEMAAAVPVPGLPQDAREAAYRAYRGWRIGDDGEGKLHAALVAYERQRAGHVVPAEARHLIAQAEAADTAYRLAEARVTVYEFLHQYGLSDLPLFKVAIDLAVSLRKIIDGTGEADHG